MKAAFFHDTILGSDDQKTYYSLRFPYSLWQRYLTVFDRLIVSTRTRTIEQLQARGTDTGGLSVSSGDHVGICPVTAYQSPADAIRNTKQISHQVMETINAVDCSIIRLQSIIGFFACHRSIRMQLPWAVELVACPWDGLWNYGTVFGKISAPIAYFLTRHYVKKAPYVLYVTKDFLQKRYPAKGYHTGVSDVQITTSDLVLCQRIAKINTQVQKIIFGLAGSLDVGFKGHKQAILALARIKDQLPDFTLRMIGEGNAEKWKALAKKHGIAQHLEFCGTVPSGNPVLKWLDETDVFLIPSLQEGLPRILVEAMSRGCPAIGARTGGIPELLPGERLYHPHDINALAKRILSLVNDRQEQIKDARRNFEKSKEFSAHILDRQRDLFWQRFKECVAGQLSDKKDSQGESS